ncbi:helix-turn-helix domain-containing protein [Phormidium sp. FACHB-592]|uniref:Helix-turn-helix domain-containing protein n=1 Tax=Stenomitos frigidus AS-A4 TaxID=2933935 RepID=A0ABV0KJK8_9CYAN|nr:helix-turn-helix domain-containing protein [Phormidium sp. FACHB-592]MBD2074728.1 helix-turn-helix domain-containing protein [Phormidium sp. FACHB-592]
MTSRKLSDSDKQEMLQLYRQPGETTSTLASRYGVSNSTISRILKTSFSEAEYETLIQQKRGGRSAIESLPPSLPDTEPLVSIATEPPAPEESLSIVEEPVSTVVDAGAIEVETPLDAEPTSVVISSLPPIRVDESLAVPTMAVDEPEPANANGRRLRKRSSAPSEPERSLAPSEPVASIAPPTIRSKMPGRVDRSAASPLEEAVPDANEPAIIPLVDLPADDRPTAAAIVEGTALLDDGVDLTGDLEEEDLDDDDLDELDDDDLDDDDLDDDLENGSLLVGSRIAGKMLVQVLPLAEASLPRTCYLVVDRAAELIARPLKEFGDLGQIPEAETLEKTLPIFDNHRIAKRYSNPRTQRVIKLPDGQVLQKTSSHLQAKGITRLLIDGQVYAL